MQIMTLHRKEQFDEYYRKGYWKEDTYASLLARNAQQWPDREALYDGRRRYSFREFDRLTDRLALRILRSGVRKGDVVSLLLPSSTESVMTYVACGKVGAVANTSLNLRFREREIVNCLNKVRTKVIVVIAAYRDANFVEILSRVVGELPHLERIILVGEPPASVPPALEGKCASWNEWMADPVENEVMPGFFSTYPERGLADDINYFGLTSGTTGDPKVVMHTPNSILANARGMTSDWGITDKDIIFSISPFYHHIALVAFAQAVLVGARLVLIDPFDGKNALRMILEEKVTYAMGVPTHAIDILSACPERLDGLALRIFYMAGAPISPELASRIRKVLGATPQNVYGMTENSSHNYTRPDDSFETTIGTCGRPCEGYEVEIFDPGDRNRQLPQGEVGEIGTRGPLLMAGYFADQHRTAESFNDAGWFMSGDLGMLDAQGNLKVIGRTKDMIIRGGHKIYPAEIENVLHGHPDVLKVAIIGIPDARLGERAMACVIPKAGRTVTLHGMNDYLLANGVVKYDLPEMAEVFDAFPMTPSGKVLKRVLREKMISGTAETRVERNP